MEKFSRFSFVNETQSSVKIELTLPDNEKIVYDKVVDDSQFRPDSENVRSFQLTGSGSIGIPQYDEHPEEVTQTELEIRSGRLDKAEISQLKQIREKELNETHEEFKKEKAAERLEKENKARQDYIDKATGFKGNQSSAKG